MEPILHKSTTRGHANNGWLDTWHTFSFGDYHDPSRMHFGALHVLNDDTVAPGMGFGRHAHEDMEIITLPLEGTLEHTDSMGNTTTIRPGQVQVMSAGTGIEHSERNADPDLPARLLQIWVYPNQQQVTPRYEQASFTGKDLQNRLATIISPVGNTDGLVHINQDAWFSLAKLDKGITLSYAVKKEGNGVYAFLIEGDVTINEIVMNRRDGLGLSKEPLLTITANADAELLLIEVPMPE